MTATEEFGIAAVEALAAGRPVIALSEGGVRESVTEGVTGTFYDADDPEALAGAVAAFDALAVDPAACRAAAERFGAERFRRGSGGSSPRRSRAERPPRPGERRCTAASPRRVPRDRGQARDARSRGLPKSCVSP